MTFDRVEAALKSGQEQLISGDKALPYSLLDFWRWSVSDILSNATRGRLAEFIVATAVGVDINKAREEWSAFDLETPAGLKLEVKSAAYLQSWFQRALSIISFSTKPARHWDSQTNRQAAVAARHADVYVFCLLHHHDKRTVNPLDLNQWEFYVLATAELNNYARSQHSITLKSLRGLSPAVTYNQLAEEVARKNQLNLIQPG